MVVHEPEQQLIDRWIVQDPTRPGPQGARLKEHGVPVWILVGYWQGSDEDADAVAQAYDLPLEAVRAAIAYYHHHRVAIDARIALNIAAFNA